MRYEVNIELLGRNLYKEIEIDVYRRGNRSSNDFVYDRTIRLGEDAILRTIGPDDGDESSHWILELDDQWERRLFTRADYLQFMVAIYKNSDEKPYPDDGRLLLRRPMVRKMFLRPGDFRRRGSGRELNLFSKDYNKFI